MKDRIIYEAFKDLKCDFFDFEHVALVRESSSPLSEYSIDLYYPCECGSYHATHDQVRDEIVCNHCGLVLCENHHCSCYGGKIMRKGRTPPSKRLLEDAKAVLSKCDSIYVGNLKFWIEEKHYGIPIPAKRFDRVIHLLSEDEKYVIEAGVVWKARSQAYKDHVKRMEHMAQIS